MITLCSASTTDGYYPSATGILCELRDIVFIARGTFDGATVTIEISDDAGATFVPVANGSFTAAGTLRLQVGSGQFIRAVITNDGVGTSITLRGS